MTARIMIDLGGCQQPGTHSQSGIALAQAVAREAAQHADRYELWIAFSTEFPAQLHLLRDSFGGSIPPERLVVYALPALAHKAHSARARSLVRAHFFQGLKADIVFVPGAPGSEHDSGATPHGPRYLHGAGVADAPSAWLAFDQLIATRLQGASIQARARLAWVAPSAPDGATAALLAELARSYDIDTVVPAVEDGTGPLRSGAWFEQHHGQFARVLYHVANSAAHGAVLRLLARHPGIVVLHDFSIGEAVAAMGLDAAGLREALYHGHGYHGLMAQRRLGNVATTAALPLNRIVFDQASGVIVDPAAAAPMRVATRDWYGPRSAANWYEAAPRAAEYAAAIEDIAENSATARYPQLLRELAATGVPANPRNPSLIATASAIAANRPANAPRQLLVDISAMILDDLKTGIQRVVRSILLALINDPPAGFRVEPVYGNGYPRRYRYARGYMLALLGLDSMPMEDDPIEYQAGDIFLGLDLAAHSTVNNLDMLDDMRAAGVAIHFVVYDMLPLLRAHDFPYGTSKSFGEYLSAIARHADGLVCISRAVADELGEWFEAHPVPRDTALKLAHFHLGADLDASAPSTGMPDNAPHVLASMAMRPSILMVGTLEPRKSHAQVLAAFELLWQQGVDVNLVIVGKQGWLVETLAEALRAHPQLGKKLFWLPGVSDQMLTEVYRLASALLAASVGEGFGLPLIEAAQHGLPIIARGLPVFREVSGEHAFYFDGLEPAQLADAIEQWLALFHEGRAPASVAMPWLTWSDSARQLLAAIVNEQWYRKL
jgi:glycosyltransferase involved in cell wall biosynthesis